MTIHKNIREEDKFFVSYEDLKQAIKNYELIFSPDQCEKDTDKKLSIAPSIIFIANLFEAEISMAYLACCCSKLYEYGTGSVCAALDDWVMFNKKMPTVCDILENLKRSIPTNYFYC